ncbi:SipW-dependent-type signal peptide-containing protein [Agreia sp. COWG]|uniref:SipW-dependent-type signal peptide-containing protein n=1 Tax=Agreia sp. COWG TaxID=2773266 RepID=UPI001925AF77|nr:SipW-dependent-type signal peptide-containing protein [Agreia sp. COWG]CAD5991076.1 Acyl-CoA dehydrogenase [Agreia sp. COWG]
MTQIFETNETSEPTGVSSSKKRATRQKALALLAAGLVVGVGATVTLAVWNDSEWIVGGTAGANGQPGTPGVGTSTFEVQQNTSSPFVAASFADREVNPGGSLTFTPGALALAPGDAVYAPVSLSTTSTSVAAPSVTLAGSVAAANIPVVDAGSQLSAALQLRVTVTTTARGTAPACNAASFAAGSTYVVGGAAATAPLNTAGTGVSTLAAASGNQLNYCFEITLPAGASDTLQGRTVAPAWQFVSASELN